VQSGEKIAFPDNAQDPAALIVAARSLNSKQADEGLRAMQSYIRQSPNVAAPVMDMLDKTPGGSSHVRAHVTGDAHLAQGNFLAAIDQYNQALEGARGSASTRASSGVNQ
jgi:hypothetical protein